RGLTCVVLEGRSVEQPDRQSADRDDAKKNEREGDVRLPLGIVLSKAVHLPGNPRSCGAEGDRTPDLMSAIQMPVSDPTFVVSLVFAQSGYRKVRGVMRLTKVRTRERPL